MEGVFDVGCGACGHVRRVYRDETSTVSLLSQPCIKCDSGDVMVMPKTSGELKNV